MANTVAVFDLDGTLTSGHIWAGFLRYCLWHQKRRAWIVRFWMKHLPLSLLARCRLINKGKYRSKWVYDLSGVFKGLSREGVLEASHWVSNNYIFNSLREDVVDILHEHIQSGHIVVIVSASFYELVEIVGQKLGVPAVIGTKLEVKDGLYTGRIVKPACFGENKAILLKKFLSDKGLEMGLSSSFAYADSFTDIPLLKLAGNPVATYPDEQLHQFAVNNGWKVLP